jgi:DNA-binding Lrp family transcriptional regulator
LLTVSEDDIQILNLLQRDFPLSQRPFSAIAAKLGNNESEIVKRLQTLQEAGVISRLGAVFNHEKAGASTLVAMAVPEQQIEDIAGYISALPQVNHNYKREHRYNLWFVLTASTQAEIDAVLEELQRWPGFPLLDLPMEKGYHIDLGFPLC